MIAVRRQFALLPSETSRPIRRITSFAAILLAACNSAVDPEQGSPDDPLLPPDSRVIGLAMSFQTTCALTAVAKLYCWGENRAGEFGNGTTLGASQPVPAGGSFTFDLIAGSMGTPQMCGRTRDGVTYCWGYNVNGELGDGTQITRTSPARVSTNEQFSAIASSSHTCAVSAQGTAFCWGSGISGQLGTGNDNSSLSPTRVLSPESFGRITNGFQFSCALTRLGEARCWGRGQGLGSGPADRSVNVPTAVTGEIIFQSISAGENHVCAAAQSGTVYCWGTIGLTAPFAAAPVRTVTPKPIVVVVSGSRMFVAGASCGLTREGEAYCWSSGQAQPVPGNHRFAGLAGGPERFCGHTVGGAIVCWRLDSDGTNTGWIVTVPQQTALTPAAQ